MPKKSSQKILYGKQTKLAVKNFQISGWSLPIELIAALAFIKKNAALSNEQQRTIPKGYGKAIAKAADEVLDGKHAEQFPVDVFQTGSGTSTNMNMNEVLATLASTAKQPVHPNDHVNCGQSSNDVFPTAIQVACALRTMHTLFPILSAMQTELLHKGAEFHHIIKTGRTHLMDAVPVRLGEEFHAYAALLEKAMWKLHQAVDDLCILPLGGTAVGTGINAHPKFASKTIERMSKEVDLTFTEAGNHMAAQSCPTALLSLSSALRETATVLNKIANDIRHMSSGPLAGLNEITVPELQAGSSIMPGKVNPILCESVMQVAMYVQGADATVHAGVTYGSEHQLNTAYPIMAQSLLMSLRLLSNVAFDFTKNCIMGIGANTEMLVYKTARNPMLATALNPYIGYDVAAKIAKEATKTGETILEVAIRHTNLPQKKLEKILDAGSMC